MTRKRIGLSEICLETSSSGTLLEVLHERGIYPEDCCMGAGNCGRCRVRYLEGMPSPKMEERRFFSPEELRSGMRLACLHRVCRVRAGAADTDLDKDENSDRWRANSERRNVISGTGKSGGMPKSGKSGRSCENRTVAEYGKVNESGALLSGEGGHGVPDRC